MHTAKLPVTRNKRFIAILGLCLSLNIPIQAQNFFPKTKTTDAQKNSIGVDYSEASWSNDDIIIHPSKQKAYLHYIGSTQIKTTKNNDHFNRLMLIPVSDPKELPKPTFTEYAPVLSHTTEAPGTIDGTHDPLHGNTDPLMQGETNLHGNTQTISGENGSNPENLIAENKLEQQEEDQQEQNEEFDLDKEGLTQDYLGHIPVDPSEFLKYFEDETGQIESIIEVPFTVPNDQKLQELDTNEKDNYSSPETHTKNHGADDTHH